MSDKTLPIRLAVTTTRAAEIADCDDKILRITLENDLLLFDHTMSDGESWSSRSFNNPADLRTIAHTLLHFADCMEQKL